MPVSKDSVRVRRFSGPIAAPDAAMLAAFAEDGYLLIENFMPAADCDRLMAAADSLIETYEPAPDATVFSTRTAAHAADRYFQESGDKIRFFLEEEAIDERGALIRPKRLAVNKIGHALHDLDPVFSDFSRRPAIAALAARLFAAPLLLQSMYIFKQPGIGGEVSWHQDSTYLYTEPMSCIGFWFALEDADLDNGAMLALPGGHRGPLRRRFRRRDDRLVTEMLDPAPWPDLPPIALEAPKGTLILLHGLLPHASGPNRSARSRQAYTLHLIDGTARYPRDNWLLRGPDLPLRGF